MPPHSVPVVMSVLDRLLDNSDDAAQGASISRLKEALQRDLEWLLNTRRIPDLPSDDLKEINRSIYVFGIPDFTAFGIAAQKEQTKLVRAIHTAIKTFEPRIRNLRVFEVGAPNIRTRTLHLRIEGQLQVDPAPVDVSFDTVLQLSTGKHEVRHA